MFLRIFKGTGPGVIFLIFVTLAAVWINAFVHHPVAPAVFYETNPMPLYGLLKSLVNNHQFFGIILSFLMVSVLSVLLVNFNTSVFFINERTFLPALFYVLLGGLFPEYQLLNPLLPAAIFLIVAIIRIMEGYHITGTAYNYFDAGILISTGSLFYASLIWFGLLLIIGIILLRTGNLKELAISIMGLLTPYLIIFGIYYVVGKDVGSLVRLFSDNLFTRSMAYQFTRLTTVTLIFYCVLIIVSMVQLFKHINTKKIKSRKTFSLLIWTFLISVFVYILLPSVSVEMIWITGIPVSYFFAQYFLLVKKKLVPEILFFLMIAFVVLIQVLHH
jgi:hypothetical protein